MKRKIAFILALFMIVSLSTFNNLVAYAEDWKLPEGTRIYKPARTMALDFGTLTILDAGFAKEAQSIIQASYKTVNGVKKETSRHVGYYTAKDGRALFAFKGLLYNSSDKLITLESLNPTIRFSEEEPTIMYGYPAVPFGIQEYYTLEPNADVEIVFACTAPNAMYYGNGDVLLEFAGGTFGFQRADLGNYNSIGFTADDGKEAGDLTEVPANQEEGVIVANQPHVDEVQAEDVSLEYDSGRDEYRVHVKLRNLTGYPLIHDKLPNGGGVNVLFLDSNGDVLPNGEIDVGSTSSYSDLAVGQAGWDNSYKYVSKAVVDSTEWIRISSYRFSYFGINSDGSTQSIKGTFSEPLVIAISDILSDRKNAINDEPTSNEERFFLRNGIMFGDTKNSVQKKEFFTLSNTSSATLARVGNVAGYNDTQICFYFDDSDKLDEMYYMFDTLNSRDESIRRYEAIYSGLVKKYGEPLNIAEGEFYPLLTRAFDYYNNASVIVQYTGRKAVLDQYSEWLIKDGKGYVKIDLVGAYYGDPEPLSYHLDLAYKHFDSDSQEQDQIRSENDL